MWGLAVGAPVHRGRPSGSRQKRLAGPPPSHDPDRSARMPAKVPSAVALIRSEMVWARSPWLRAVEASLR
jgi:hypothetical protein